MGVCRASTRISGSPTIAVLFLYIRLIIYIKKKKEKKYSNNKHALVILLCGKLS